MEKIFYDKNGNKEGLPKGANRKIGKWGEILPKYDEKGREIVGENSRGPVVKLKFRESKSVTGELNCQLEQIEKYGEQLSELLSSKSVEVRRQMIEITERYPGAVDFIEQVCLRQTEIWFYLGKHEGIRFVIGEKSNSFFKGFKKSLNVAGSFFLTMCEPLLHGIFI
jgi:hypothetical protein